MGRRKQWSPVRRRVSSAAFCDTRRAQIAGSVRSSRLGVSVMCGHHRRVLARVYPNVRSLRARSRAMSIHCRGDRTQWWFCVEEDQTQLNNSLIWG